MSLAALLHVRDAVAEWLRRRPAKPLGFAREGSNPSGVVLFKSVLFSETGCLLPLVLMLDCPFEVSHDWVAEWSKAPV